MHCIPPREKQTTKEEQRDNKNVDQGKKNKEIFIPHYRLDRHAALDRPDRVDRLARFDGIATELFASQLFASQFFASHRIAS
jgi:hypothetical protein